MIKKITKPYFHKGLKFITPAFFGLGIYLFYIKHPFWGTMIMLAGILILTTRYVTEFNLKTLVCRDYLECFSISFDEELKNLRYVDRIVITKGDYSQMINTRSRSRQLDWVDYSGTLLFTDNNEPLTLITRNVKEDLIKELREFGEYLQVNIEDRTTKQYYQVDLSRH